MAESDKKTFWTSMPGILAGIAAVIAAITSLYVAINSNKEKSNNLPVILYQTEGPFHIGDEEFSEWPSLHGNCFEISFNAEFELHTLTLNLERFGAEVENAIYLNNNQIAILPPQGTKKANQIRPNQWSDTVSISISTTNLVKGFNKLSICAGLVQKPEFKDDKDDFQIRKIKLVAE